MSEEHELIKNVKTKIRCVKSKHHVITVPSYEWNEIDKGLKLLDKLKRKIRYNNIDFLIRMFKDD